MIHSPIPVHFTTEDGVGLHILHTDRHKTAQLSVLFVDQADPVRSPVRSLLMGVLRLACAAYPRPILLNRRLDELWGASLSVRNELRGDAQTCGFTLEIMEDTFLPRNAHEGGILAAGVRLLAELLLHPLLDVNGLLSSDSVAREKAAAIDIIRAERNDPRTYAANRFRQTVCAGEPYGISLSGTEETIAAMNPTDVTAEWRTLLTRSRCEVFYVGRADAEAVRSLWIKAFPAGSLISCHDGNGCVRTSPHPCPVAVRTVEEALPVSQGRLYMGWTSGLAAPPAGREEDLAAALLYNELLGVMQNALLFRYIREELGLCYECDSLLDANKGVLAVSAAIHPDRREETRAAIENCVKRVRRSDISEDDLTAAKASLMNAYCQISDSLSAMEGFWLGQILRGSCVTPEDCLGYVGAMTMSDVVDMAGRFVFDTEFFLRGTLTDEDLEEQEDSRYDE